MLYVRLFTGVKLNAELHFNGYVVGGCSSSSCKGRGGLRKNSGRDEKDGVGSIGEKT